MDTYLNSIIWRDDFWFPETNSWTDLESQDPDVYYPKIRDLTLPSLFVAVLLLFIRHIYDKFVVLPVCSYIGISSEKSYKVESLPVLEAVYRTKATLNGDVINGLAKKTNLSKIYIQSWFRRRQLKDSQSKLQKISENSWNFLFYFGAFIYGFIVLWNKKWFSETKYCWKDWPRQHVTSDIYWFYLIEIAFYWSQTFSLLIERKKKDFIEMIVHHTSTIALLYFSWASNFVRFGSLVILVHDAVDYWLAAAKIAKYCKKQNLCEALFVVFIIVWFVTRLGLYPFRLLYSVTYEIHDYIDPFPSHDLFKLLLYTLQILHFVWTYMILRIALQKFISGQIEKDVRSDTESDDVSDAEEKPAKQNGFSNHTIHKHCENGNLSLRSNSKDDA